MRLKLNQSSVMLCALLFSALPLPVMADVFAPAGKANVGAADPEVVARLNQLESELRRMQGRPAGSPGLSGEELGGDVIGTFNGKPVIADPVSAMPATGAPVGAGKVPSLPPPPPAPAPKAAVKPAKPAKSPAVAPKKETK